MWANHMIGDSSRKKIVSVTTPATKRKPPPNARRSDGRVSTSITVAIFGANHITSTSTNTGEAGVGAHEGVGRAGASATAIVPNTSSPIQAGRAEEHQHREHELVAADRLEPGHHQKMPVLHVALAPAQVAADEFEQRRRILLEAVALLRQHAHLVAGAPHQHRLDLVVAEHVAADGALSASTGSWQCSMNGASRTMALWPQ